MHILKTIIFFICLLPVTCMAQFTITGRVLNQADTKPVALASVFLSNATVGDKTTNDGTFTLRNVKPGKYNIVVSVIGFEAYTQTILVNNNIALPDIIIFPKTIALQEVKIKPKNDADKKQYYEWFKSEFLGKTALAKDCRILNPDVIEMDYDEKTSTLTASSYDFIEIENDALGYRIKYLLNNFTLNDKNENARRIFYEGSALFENLKGTPAQQRDWLKKRQEVYEGSPMHFFRSILSNRLAEEGFRVAQYAVYQNPERPADSLINAKIAQYKTLKDGDERYKDSLAVWTKKAKLQKTFERLMTYPLKVGELIKRTDTKGLLALTCNYDGLFITYRNDHNFRVIGTLARLSDAGNTENTLARFNDAYTIFDSNGTVINPESLTFTGVWGRNRIAGILPSDYEVPMSHSPIMNIDSTVIKSLSAKFENYTTKHIAEKAYLHFDKPFYAAGDTVYFKAYITLGAQNKPTNLSGVLHVDLINTINKIDQSIKLQVKDGVAWGDFALPDSLPKGNYRIRAYTQWMRNESESAFFYQTIPFGSAIDKKIPESGMAHTAAAKPDVQFFPEGGNLVTGIRSKIAFKAIGLSGLGVDVKGLVLDNDNKQVATFASAHLGMGYFYLEPQPGKIYRAEVTYPNGVKDVVELSVVSSMGISLAVTDDSLVFNIKVSSSAAWLHSNRGKSYTLFVLSGGILSSYNCKQDSLEMNITVLKNTLRPGIATVTMFSPAGEPLAERLIFVQNDDQMRLKVSSDKNAYRPREKVSLKINTTVSADTAFGHFSVSVINESMVKVDEKSESTIINNLLLTSDLKGYIEQPNYYFINISDKTRSNLDLVMLTHGYRRFSWRSPDNSQTDLAYKPEKGIEIAGTAKGALGSVLKDGTVSLISVSQGVVATQLTDNKGGFSFSNLMFTDTGKFVLQAINKKGSNKTELLYKKEIPPSITPLPAQNEDVNQLMTTYLENNKKQLNEYNLYGKPKGIMLKEVKIKDLKLKNNYRSSALGGPGHADQVLTSEDIGNQGGSLAQILDGRLRNVNFATRNFQSVAYLGGGMGFGPMQIVVDGVLEPLKPPYDINNVNPNDVETVEVLKGANAGLYEGGSFSGVLVITTKQGTGKLAKDIASIGVLPIKVNGFYKAREFYAPKYEQGSFDNKLKDLRTIIYWKPEITTDATGNTTLEFYNADGKGSYRVVVEGIDANGNLGRQVYRYNVE
jgi:hypothetical protein